MSDIRTVTVLTPCYNEAENVRALYERVRAVFLSLGEYRYEHIFIDNASTDETVSILRAIAAQDGNVKVIVNTRNFGHVRSPYHALLQCRGDAVIGMAADLQDPPELIPAFLAKWREGYKVVLGVKSASEESASMFAIRRLGYGVIDLLSEVKQIRNCTGFGLYDQGVQGIVNHSKIPLRLATMIGFCSSVVSLVAAFVYFWMKMLFWYNLPIGIAPLIIGLFGVASVQLFFLGVLGEYVGSIHTQVRNRPLVIERERINFGDETEMNDG